MGNTQNTLKCIMEQNFQYLAQKEQKDNNLDTFADHFPQHFGQKPTPQQCREIIKSEILSKLNPIG